MKEKTIGTDMGQLSKNCKKAIDVCKKIKIEGRAKQIGLWYGQVPLNFQDVKRFVLRTLKQCNAGRFTGDVESITVFFSTAKYRLQEQRKDND